MIQGNEIYCFRNKIDYEQGVPHRIMHSLIGTFI